MLSIRKNPVKLRKTITIKTQADALAYFQADDEATQAEHVQACKPASRTGKTISSIRLPAKWLKSARIIASDSLTNSDILVL